MRIYSMTVFFSLALILSACNTFQGMGKDIENAGEGLSNTAQKVQEEINK
jgi:predicted small secreted protein